MSRLKFLRAVKEDLSEKLEAARSILDQVEARLETSAPLAVDEQGTALTVENIACAVDRITDAIIQDTVRRKVILFPMDGALPYAADILANFNHKAHKMTWLTVKVTSYEGTTSGELTMQFPKNFDFINTVVYVLDDVLDTGKTSLALFKRLKAEGVEQVKFAPMIDKYRSDRAIQAWHAGFTVDHEAFVIGKGLDYNKRCRNLPDVRIAPDALLPNAEEAEILKAQPVIRSHWKMVDELQQNLASSVITSALRKNRFFKHVPQASVVANAPSTGDQRSEMDPLEAAALGLS